MQQAVSQGGPQDVLELAAHEGLDAARPAVRRQGLDLWWLLSTAALAAIFVMFAWVHFVNWRDTGRPAGLGLMAQETIAVVLIIVRRRARGTSRSPLAWLATGIGAFGILAARPANDALFGLEPLYIALQFTGALMASASLGFLGRSFGIVPANRGVQDGGPYRIVRHPVYASYLVTQIAYLLENPTFWNLGVVAVATAFQLVRIAKEEEFLSSDPQYTAYMRRVRWRLVPLVY